jgi:hypothetical protein
MISEKLEKLVEEMVDKGVQFEDAVREFEKRFIARVLGNCEGSLTKSADTLGMPQCADTEDGSRIKRGPDNYDVRSAMFDSSEESGDKSSIAKSSIDH